MNTNDKKIMRWVIRALILLIIFVIILLLLRSCHKQPEAEETPTTEESKSLDFIPADNTQESITIPAVTGLNLLAEQIEQKVDFFNPDDNKCYFKISLYLSDDTLIYQSDLIKPSEHITDISLNQTLQRGVYQNCRLAYDCFSLDDSRSPLNSGNVILEITSR